MTEDRYSRQRRLAELGEEGQARIHATAFEIRGHAGADVDVERAYLERAGARTVHVASGDAPLAFAHAAVFRFAAARDVGAGAWRALAQLRPLLRSNSKGPRP